MEDKLKQQLTEQYEDAALFLLMNEYANNEGERLLQDYEQAVQNSGEINIPSALDEKCKVLIEKTFEKQQHSAKLKRFRSSVARAAVIVLILLGGASALVLSVDAIRIPVLNFILDESGKYSSLVRDQNAQPQYSNVDPVAERFEAYIPEGYQIVSRINLGTQFTLTYRNSDGYLIYLQYVGEQCELNVDTEEVGFSSADLGDFTAVFRDKEGYTLMWLDSNSQKVYTLFANGLNNAEFWKYAYRLIG